MDAGTFRHRVEVQEHTETRGASGEIVQGWDTVATRWCSIDPMSGRELTYAQQVHAESRVRIRMRYYAGLTPKHRLKWGNRFFDILDVRNYDERNEFTEIMCAEAGNAKGNG